MSQLGQSQLGEFQLGEEAQQIQSGTVETATTVSGQIQQATKTGTVETQAALSTPRDGAVSGVATISGQPTDATAVEGAFGNQWRILRDGTTEEPDLFDVEVVDTFNPFGNYAIAYIDDQEGDKFSDYNRGTRVDFEYSTNGGISYNQRFTGYVVEAREQDKQGADSLEVECYSFDQFLRQNTVSNDQSGKTRLNALEDIVKEDTPVTWNASNVDVVDNSELTRSYRGELVENALQALSANSGGEAFGVNNDLEFFFRPREAENAPRNIDNTQWFDYDIPEEGKETINQVTVFFNDGSKSVTVDNGGDKLDLQDSLNTQDPVVLGKEVSRPDITDIEDARAVGEQIISDRDATLTGTVTTYDLLEAKPGDVISIEIIPRGIDGNFRIAEVKYRWGTDETVLTVVEKKGNQDEVLVRLSDAVQRLETKDVDRDAIQNRITSTNVGVVLPVSGSVGGTSLDSAIVTNSLRNQLRDAWGDNTTVDVAEIAVGNGTASPSRSDTSLANELSRSAVSESFPDNQSVLYEISTSETDIREIGLFDNSNNLLARAVIPETTFSGTTDIDLQIDVEDDPAFDSGVVTLDGQTSVRDIIADNSPAYPSEYAYGSDGTTPTINDTSLGNQQTTVDLTELLVQNVDSQSEWNEILSINSDEAVKVTAGGELVAEQAGWFEEGENADRFQDGFDDGSTDTEISNNDYLSLSRGPNAGQATGTADFAEWDFTVNYEIPSSDFAFYIRQASDGVDGAPTFKWELEHENGTTYTVDRNENLGAGLADNFAWDELPFFQGSQPEPIADIVPGDYTLRVEILDSDGAADKYMYWIDAIWVGDDGAFSFDFDETVNGSDALDGPQEYPDLVEKEFASVSTRREFDTATCEQTWDDTSNNQFIELSNDGGSTFIRTNNSQTATASFASSSTQLLTNVGISRYTSDSTTSPATGDTPQAIDVHQLFANINAITPSDIGLADIRAIVTPNTINGTTLREGGQLDGSSNLLTRSIFAAFTVEQDERVISSEKFSWANP